MSRKKAFSLIEIMVVVAIVAIIAAVASVSFSSMSAKSKWAEVTPCLGAAALNLENYRNNHGRYPTADVWDAINLDGDCSDHYEGYITVFDSGARYIIAFCDRKKSIWSGGKNDVWLVIDSDPAPIHYRDSVNEETVTIDSTYESEIDSNCAASW